jgi:uncharacterized protein YjcR
MNATPVKKDQRELVRILYLNHGHQLASEMSGVSYQTVRKWASRYNWKSMSQPVTSPTKAIADKISDTLAEHERETRLSLARYARRAASDAENATLRDAPLVHKAAQVAGIVHKWDSEKSNTQFTLNVLNINSLDNRLGEDSTVIDAQE